jgi:serine/threonine protein kinase
LITNFFIYRLNCIHEERFIHRDLHSGNILSVNSKWHIGDLGLSQPANITSSNNNIYGVIPYIAPEIFNGNAFTKESDIYSMGMIMWELTSGCKPFADFDHDTDLIYKIIDGKRPEITNDTPECFANLIKRCWDSDPSKRPHIEEIRNTITFWTHMMRDIDQFNQAEKTRLKLVEEKKLGLKLTMEIHPGAIYTSRLLSSLISKSLSISSSSSSSSSLTLSYNTKQSINSIIFLILKYYIYLKINDFYHTSSIFLEYISKDLEFDINDAKGY